MTFTRKALLIVAALTLAACQNPDRYGSGNLDNYGNGGYGANGAGNGANGGYIDTTGLGDPNNPASIAYFNQSVGDRVHFANDQSTLNDENRSVLIGQARWLNANPQYGIIVEGHADEKGTREYNLALGARRAASVQQFLISQGVSGSRMRTISYGKERPIEVCSEEACYYKNRRAVTVLSAGSGV